MLYHPKNKTTQDPMPLSLLQNQARNIGGDALLAPELNDSFTWTAPIIKQD